jgi:hypothetical protein
VGPRVEKGEMVNIKKTLHLTGNETWSSCPQLKHYTH